MLRAWSSLVPRIASRRTGLLALYSTHALSGDVLRPYQRSCIEAIQEALGRRKRPAVSLPTGSGKTHVFSYLLQHVKPMYPEDSSTRTKVLVIVNRKELMEQSLHRIRETHPGLTVLPISGKQGYDEDGDVFVSTYQTLMREARLSSIDPHAFKLIVIDEAHHSVADSYIRILSHFNAVIPPDPKEPENVPVAFEDLTALPSARPAELLNRNTDPEGRRVHVVGFSATFWRNDSEFLREVYDEIAFHENVNSMIDNGYLCPAKITKIELGRGQLSSLAAQTGTLRAQDFFMHPSGMDLVFNTWKAHSTQKSTVIFGCNLAHINGLVALFRNYGVDARCVHGGMAKNVRAEVLARFAAGEFPVLLNCQVLTEGTDIPRIDQVMIARGLGSTGMAMQMIGRGLRPHAEKEFCNVILFANFARFEGNLDFLPQLESLFDTKAQNAGQERIGEEDSEVLLDDLNTDEEAKPGLDLDIDYGKLMLETRHFEPALLASARYRPQHPLKSALMWLEWQKSFYLFPTSHGGYFAIKRQASSGLWVATFVKQLNAKFKYSQTIIQSSDLVDVLLAAETHALSRWGHQGVRPLSTDSPWHYEAPTPKQIKLLEKKDFNSASVITRGVAAGLINLISIGCKLTPELVQAVQNLIGKYKSLAEPVDERKPVLARTPRLRNPSPQSSLQNSQRYVGLVRSR